MENMSFSTRKHCTKIGEEEEGEMHDFLTVEQLFLKKLRKASRAG